MQGRGPDAFASANLKIARAHEINEELNREVNAFMESAPYEINAIHEATGFLEAPWFVFRIRVRQPPPSRWGPIAGDLMQNFRAALDHAVFGLSASGDRTAFPIYADALSYTAGKPSARDRCLEGVEEHFRVIIDRAQPFNNVPADPRDRDPLLALQAFNNADKHRVLQPGFVKTREMEFALNVPPPFVQTRRPTRGVIRDGDEILGVWIDPRFQPSEDIQLIPNFELTIGFGDEAIDLFEFLTIGDVVVGIISELENKAASR